LTNGVGYLSTGKVVKVIKLKTLSTRQVTMSLLKKELSDFQRCHFTGRNFLKESYPSSCNCCKRNFSDRKSFWEATLPLEKGNYSKGTKGNVFEYRNCSDCGSTLITEFKNERDQSQKGEQCRREWAQRFKFLVSNGVDEERARSILRLHYTKDPA
jgi:hypothetical protein